MYERALEFFGEELTDETLFVAFAKFEIRCGEVWPSLSPAGVWAAGRALTVLGLIGERGLYARARRLSGRA